MMKTLLLILTFLSLVSLCEPQTLSQPASLLWVHPTPKAKSVVSSEAVVVVVTPEMVVIAGVGNVSSRNVAHGLGRFDGRQVWQTTDNQLGNAVLSPLHSASVVFFVPIQYEGKSGAQAVDVRTGRTLWQTKRTDACSNLIGVYGSVTALTDATGHQVQLVYTYNGERLDPKRAGDHDLLAVEMLAQGGPLVAVTVLGRPCLVNLDTATLTRIPLKEAVPVWENPEITRTGTADVIGPVIHANPHLPGPTAWKNLIVRVDEDNGMAGHSLFPKYLVCVGRNGERRWQFPASVSPSYKPDWSDRIRFAWMVKSAGIVIAQNGQNTLFGVDTNTGKQCWQRTLPSLIDSITVYGQGMFVLSISQAQSKRETNGSSRPFQLRRRLNYIEAGTGKIHHITDLTLGMTQKFASISLSADDDTLFVGTLNALHAYDCRALLRQVFSATPESKPNTAQLPSRYVFTLLESLPPNPKCERQGTQALAINNRGQIVGQSWERPVIWQNGKVSELPLLRGDNVGAAYAINNQGDVLIHSERRIAPQQPTRRDFLLRRGEIVPFSTHDPKVMTLLAGLNDAGQVIGQQVLAPDVSSSDPLRQTFVSHSFVWRNGVTMWLDADPVTRFALTPLTINNRGQIVGRLAAFSSNSIVGPVLWENGSTRQLEGLSLQPTAFNNDLIVGTVISTVKNEDDSAVEYREPAVWQAGRQTLLRPPNGGDDYTALALNRQGQVVGSSSIGAFVWQGGQMLFLTNVLPLDNAWVRPVAAGINDRGQIVGYRIAQLNSGQGKTIIDNMRDAFLLTPMPQEEAMKTLTSEEKEQVAKWKMEAIKTTYPDGSKATIVFHGNGQRVRLSGIASNARLYVNTVAPFSYMEASRERVMVVRRDSKRRVTKQIAWDLNQLHGSVHIPNKAAALRYVRLRTTPQTYYFWPNPEVEIVSSRDAPRLPRFGVESDWHFHPSGSGSFGIVSPHAWRVGKFTRPKVQEVADGFLITRWTYASAIVTEHASKEAGVYRIREWVGRDGAYHRRTLQIVHKTLPNTSWYMLETEE